MILEEDTFGFLEKSFVKGLHDSPKEVSRVLFKTFPEFQRINNREYYYISYDFWNIFFKNEQEGLTFVLRFLK